MRKANFFVFSLLLLMALACSFDLSTAKISEAKLAKDSDGKQPTTTFTQEEPFYCVATLSNAPDDTKVKAVWTAVEVEGVKPNLVLAEKELVSGDGALTFSYTNDENKLWPVGKYKVDLFLNGKLDQTLEFKVEAPAAPPTPTATPTPKPTVKPTATPTTEETIPTAEPTDEPTEERSTGDSLDLTSPTEEASQYKPLPFKDEPYQHPSGAFTFALPESFEEISSNETSASFGYDRSIVGAVFIDAGEEYSNKQMNDFIKAFTDSFLAKFSDNHKVLEQKDVSDGSIFEAVSFESSEGDGDADFFFEQRDTVVFVFYFISFAYEEMEPTWHKIIESYSVDAEAALAAAPASTPTPLPKPTRPPTPAGPSIPAGKGMLIMYNCLGDVVNVDVIPVGIFQELAPKTGSNCKPGQPIFLDPGEYILKASIAGRASSGEGNIKIEAGQSFEFTWQ